MVNWIHPWPHFCSETDGLLQTLRHLHSTVWRAFQRSRQSPIVMTMGWTSWIFSAGMSCALSKTSQSSSDGLCFVGLTPAWRILMIMSQHLPMREFFKGTLKVMYCINQVCHSLEHGLSAAQKRRLMLSSMYAHWGHFCMQGWSRPVAIWDADWSFTCSLWETNWGKNTFLPLSAKGLRLYLACIIARLLLCGRHERDNGHFRPAWKSPQSCSKQQNPLECNQIPSKNGKHLRTLLLPQIWIMLRAFNTRKCIIELFWTKIFFQTPSLLHSHSRDRPTGTNHCLDNMIDLVLGIGSHSTSSARRCIGNVWGWICNAKGHHHCKEYDSSPDSPVAGLVLLTLVFLLTSLADPICCPCLLRCQWPVLRCFNRTFQERNPWKLKSWGSGLIFCLTCISRYTLQTLCSTVWKSRGLENVCVHKF